MTEQVSEVKTILIIDDHPLLRKGIQQLIDLEDQLELVGEADNGADGVELVKENLPDLVLLDMNMAGMNGVETVKAIRAAGLDSKVVMFTVSDSDKDVIAAIRAGADGYLLKDMEPEDLLSNLVKAAEGELVLSPKLTKALSVALRGEKSEHEDRFSELTAREVEHLKLIAKGLSNKHIARELDITEGTVKVHVKNLLKKLELRSRVDAAVWAVKNDLG